MDKILILDFGGQTTQLISRRIRDFGVYSEIISGDSKLQSCIDVTVKGIVLSGSPQSAWKESSINPDPFLWDCGLPILGICYGFHRLALRYGARLERKAQKEYGPSLLFQHGDDPLFEGIPEEFVSWMSHGDSVTSLSKKFRQLAVSKNGMISAAVHREKKIWGLQYHPEADHCEFGSHILENFSCRICAAKREWSLTDYIEREVLDIRRKVGDKDVLILISGGVDSTVAAALLLRALTAEKLWLMYIDTGLMRLGENEEVAESLQSLGAQNILSIDARQRFLAALAGVEDPELKRKIIGDTFIKVQAEEIKRYLKGEYFLAQGTLYTDLIESGHGNHAQVIKSHHNVGTPLVQEKRDAGELLEPLRRLYKDEVRELGLLLGVRKSAIYRHPFPGPGLAIRILSAITEEKLRILREADAIYIRELKARGLYQNIWQAFAVLLPLHTVGVTGDHRDYAQVLALRAISSRDGMSAEVFDFPSKNLLEIATIITNSIEEIGRVVYDISSKPPATIEWE